MLIVLFSVRVSVRLLKLCHPTSSPPLLPPSIPSFFEHVYGGIILTHREVHFTHHKHAVRLAQRTIARLVEVQGRMQDPEGLIIIARQIAHIPYAKPTVGLSLGMAEAMVEALCLSECLERVVVPAHVSIHTPRAQGAVGDAPRNSD